MAITPPQPRSLDWHLNRAAWQQELDSLCTGHYLPLTSFELRGPDVELGGGGPGPPKCNSMLGCSGDWPSLLGQPPVIMQLYRNLADSILHQIKRPTFCWPLRKNLPACLEF